MQNCRECGELPITTGIPFVGFVTEDDSIVKMMGLGLATAIAVDVTVVRMLLAPAVLTWLGDRAWWLPRWLDRRLPRLHLEGGPAPQPQSL